MKMKHGIKTRPFLGLWILIWKVKINSFKNIYINWYGTIKTIIILTYIMQSEKRARQWKLVMHFSRQKRSTSLFWMLQDTTVLFQT